MLAGILNLTTMKTKIAKNTLYQLVGKLITMSVTVFITLLITKNYGADGYGGFSLMQSIPALFFVIVDFGLNAISVREASKDDSQIYSYFINVLIFRVLFSLFLIVVIGLGLYFFPYGSHLTFGIRLGLLLILTQGLYATTNIVFQTKLRYDLSVIGQTLGYVLVLGGSLFLVSRSASIVWVNFTYVLGGVLTFLINFILIRRLDINRTFRINTDLIKKLLRKSLPLGIMFIFSQMNFKEDAVLLSILKIPEWLDMSATEIVGVYSLPYKVFEVSLVIPTFFMNAVYPVLVKHMEEGREKLKSSFFKVLLFLFAGGVVTGILGFIFAPWIINFLGGEEFKYSISVLRILIGGAFIFYLTQPISWLIVTLDRQKYLPYIYFVSVVFNLVFNLIFIPRYSFLAAASITIGSEFLILILLGVFARKALREKYAS